MSIIDQALAQSGIEQPFLRLTLSNGKELEGKLLASDPAVAIFEGFIVAIGHIAVVTLLRGAE
ncbi:hypothetical protein [Prosthecomicrobium sp. N25]|uniref:hypothetical protein n=1 Tax=Prosthecomicrobium sp. N25 TaxID=3129254 RepID=UPI0030785EF6